MLLETKNGSHACLTELKALVHQKQTYVALHYRFVLGVGSARSRKCIWKSQQF